MKSWLFIICLISGLARAADSLPASGFRVAYVDMQKALQTTESGKAAKASLDKELNSKRTEIEKMQKQLQTEAEQFEKKAAILNEGARVKQQADLQKKFADFQKIAATSQLELQKRERELTTPILDELRSIIEGIGKEKSYQLIVEKNEGAVLYAEAGSDLTEEVVKQYNSKSHGKKKK